ncbi:UNVERIFIED_CONTAM: hypothetical protein FKN15_054857 [Acipenser sinensis]
MRMGHTNFTELIKDVLGPTFQEILLKDIGQDPFCLLVDETTDMSSKKLLCVIRYHSIESNIPVATWFLTMLPVTDAAANGTDLVSAICWTGNQESCWDGQ